MLLIAGRVSAQVDTVFWLGAPWVTTGHAGNTPVFLRISSLDNPTTVRIYQPQNTFDTTFVMTPNQLKSVNLSHIINRLEARPASTILNYGIKIETSEVVTVVYEIATNVNNPETYSLKGQNGLGKEFVTPFQTIWDNGNFSPQPKQQITIVATEDNTTVWVTPRTRTTTHPAGVTFSIVLNKGQVYNVENYSHQTSTPGNNLSGSIVVANKPISVIVSDDSVHNSAGGGCKDLMGDQIVPVDVIGTDYIVNKGSMNAGSREGIFIVATENFTSVSVNSGVSVQTRMLNKGDTYYYQITEALNFVHADKNVYLLQASGFGCELGAALLPPINCAGSDRVNFTRTNGQGFFLNLLIPTASIANFTLNGTPISATLFNTVPGTNGAWSGAQIGYSTTQIPVNSSNIIRNSTDFFALGVINGGETTGCYYHYMSSFLRKTFVDAGIDGTLCDGELRIPLTGNVSGATQTGQWRVLNGSGTFANNQNLQTEYFPTPSDYAQGSISFILESTGSCQVQRDTVNFNFIHSPIVVTSPDQEFCANNVPTIAISGSVQYATTGIWSSTNGGSFDNVNNLTTNYTPSIQELAADSSIIVMTSAGSLHACPNTKDTIIIRYTPAPTVDVGPDLVICSDQLDVVLDGVVTGPTTTGTWTTNGSGAFSPSQDNLNATYLFGSSDYTSNNLLLNLTSTNNRNCNPVSKTLAIHLVQQPLVAISTQDSICSTANVVNLSGTVSNGFNVLWTSNGLGTISNPTGLNAIYNITTMDVNNGFVDVFFSVTGVCSTVKDSIRIHFIDAPVVHAGTNITICANEAVQLNGTITGVGSQGLWQTLGTGTFVDATQFNTLYYPSNGDVANGFVDLKLTSTLNYGCIVQDGTIRVTFKSIPTASFNVNETCEQVNAVFIDQSTHPGNTITEWKWVFGDGVFSVTDRPLHAYSVGGTYHVSLDVLSSNGCRDTLTKSLIVHQNPIVDFEFTNACEKNPIYFTDKTILNDGQITNWTYDFNAFDVAMIQNPSYAFAIPGVFPVTLTVVSQYGCIGKVTHQVPVIQSPTASFTAVPSPALVGENITFTDTSTGTNLVHWLWDFSDGQFDNTEIAHHSFSEGGVYEVMMTVKDINGCFDQTKQIISVELLPVLPTGFTPNGDGENDVFIIRGGPFKSTFFKVYSQWGESIFTTNDANEGWDGTYKGEPAPLGVYSWYFVVEMGNGTIVKKSGDVTLMR